ncbi:MAG: HDIG domain-containing protein [Tannerella sp.]|jgi:putative nucleotidyltransferase with HDIG domain|nr:HDIG domain-containing protein [Tannerella sp.]
MKAKKSVVQPVILFAVAAIVLTYFFPREGRFSYQFYEGKPWRYDLLTAPFDFSIYKTESEIGAERDSMRALFSPYFRMDTDVKVRALERLSTARRAAADREMEQCLRYAAGRMERIYDAGIVAPKELEELRAAGGGRVHVVKDNVAELRDVSRLHTIRSAYEAIVGGAPPSVSVSVLKACGIEGYLTENVRRDAEMSEKVLNGQLQALSISSGMMQAGERIVDRGEVVDGETYRVLSSLRTVYEAKTGGMRQQVVTWIGQFVLIFGIMLCSGLYLASFCPNIFYSRRNLLFIVLGMLGTCLAAEICAAYGAVSIYVIPFAMLPIVVRTFFDSHAALFTHLITALLCSLLAPFPHEFLILQIVAGIAVIFSLKELTQRSQLVRCSIFVLAAYALAYLSLALYQEGDPGKIRWMMLLFFGINFVLLMFSYLLIYAVEKVFGYVSPITLVELSNINTPLLKRLSETCPGTFQHALQVSILAAEAGARVGADTQLLRTGALYHDIGKMNSPAYFTENQEGGQNPHDGLPFEESARIIIRHVADGVRMAAKASVPRQVVDFIRTHHGKGRTGYFYNSYKNAFPDREVDESLFTYPGPNPFTRETGILMMADAVEASARSLHEYTDETLRAQVDRIVDGQIADGLLKDTPLTFRDIEDVKATFVEKLKTIYHSRISYPDLKHDGAHKMMKY